MTAFTLLSLVDQAGGRMAEAADPARMTSGMLWGVAVLIVTQLVLVSVAILWYRKEQRREAGD